VRNSLIASDSSENAFLSSGAERTKAPQPAGRTRRIADFIAHPIEFVQPRVARTEQEVDASGGAAAPSATAGQYMTEIDAERIWFWQALFLSGDEKE
jgi:hypothetical protein